MFNMLAWIELRLTPPRIPIMAPKTQPPPGPVLWTPNSDYDSDALLESRSLQSLYDMVLHAVEAGKTSPVVEALGDIAEDSMWFRVAIQYCGMFFEPVLAVRQSQRYTPEEVAFVRLRALADPRLTQHRDYANHKAYPIS